MKTIFSLMLCAMFAAVVTAQEPVQAPLPAPPPGFMYQPCEQGMLIVPVPVHGSAHAKVAPKIGPVTVTQQQNVSPTQVGHQHNYHPGFWTGYSPAAPQHNRGVVVITHPYGKTVTGNLSVSEPERLARPVQVVINNTPAVVEKPVYIRKKTHKVVGVLPCPCPEEAVPVPAPVFAPGCGGPHFVPPAPGPRFPPPAGYFPR